MASGGPAPLARMYREQLGRRARPVGTVGLLPGLNTLSFETEEYLLTSDKLTVMTVDAAASRVPLLARRARTLG